jgi:hypothetical protein
MEQSWHNSQKETWQWKESQIISEIQFGSRVHMLHLPKKHISKCHKNLINIFAFTYSQSNDLVKFCRKLIHFVIYVKKKIKIIIWNALFLASNLSFLHTPHDTSTCRATTLWACSTWRYTCKVFVSIFWHFKIYQICVSKYREHMLPGAKTPRKHHSQIIYGLFREYTSVDVLTI